MRLEIERAIDGLMRRGEVSDENISIAVREVTDLYYGKRVSDGNR